MITTEQLDVFHHILINVLELPTNRDALQARFVELVKGNETNERVCVDLMRETLKLLKADTRVVFVVGQQTPHGCQLSSGKFYTNEQLAKAEVDYWHREKCDWMKRFRLDIVTELPDYMK